MSISLLDQMRAFDHKIPLKENTSPLRSLTRMNSTSAASPQPNRSLTRIKSEMVQSPFKNSKLSGGQSEFAQNSYGLINGEWSETSYVGMNILINVLASTDNEICAQASAKINTILHSRSLQNIEEACYLIASVEKVMQDRLEEGIIMI